MHRPVHDVGCLRLEMPTGCHDSHDNGLAASALHNVQSVESLHCALVEAHGNTCRGGRGLFQLAQRTPYLPSAQLLPDHITARSARKELAISTNYRDVCCATQRYLEVLREVVPSSPSLDMHQPYDWGAGCVYQARSAPP
jgi:hypothetical protein